jgi:peroxiredoxin (alkyl hydroperoxide reductase subunit C)
MSLVGKPAPLFELDGYFNGKFETFRLDKRRGKWVCLLYYPLDFTFVCPTEVLSYSASYPQFAERNCEVFGISVDSKFVHKAWVETPKDQGGLGGKLAYPLLADLKKQAASDYGVLDPGGAVALRGLFLIDPDGVVSHETVNFLPVGRSAKETLRTLSAFQYVASHKGEVCPADWEEGKTTMQASPEGMRAYLTKK